MLAATPARLVVTAAASPAARACWSALGTDAGAADDGGRVTLTATSAAPLDADAGAGASARALAAAARGALDTPRADAARLLPAAAGSRPGGRIVATCVAPWVAFDAVAVRGAAWRRGEGRPLVGAAWGWLTVDAARRLAAVESEVNASSDATPPTRHRCRRVGAPAYRGRVARRGVGGRGPVLRSCRDAHPAPRGSRTLLPAGCARRQRTRARRMGGRVLTARSHSRWPRGRRWGGWRGARWRRGAAGGASGVREEGRRARPALRSRRRRLPRYRSKRVSLWSPRTMTATT